MCNVYDLKDFFQIYKTKNRESIGPLKNIQGDIVSSDEEMEKIFKKYFLCFYTRKHIGGANLGNRYRGRVMQRN